MEIRAPRVSLVILNWLKTDETLACLGSLRAQDHSCEVVVVDNGSPTGSRGPHPAGVPRGDADRKRA